MPGKISTKAAYATFPLGTTAAGKGISNRIGVTGANSFQIPEYWKGRFLRVKARKSAFAVNVSVGAKTLSFTQASAPGAEVDTAGWIIENGETSPDGIVPMDATSFNWAAEGIGDLIFFVSEPESAFDDGRAVFP